MPRPRTEIRSNQVSTSQWLLAGGTKLCQVSNVRMNPTEPLILDLQGRALAQLPGALLERLPPHVRGVPAADAAPPPPKSPGSGGGDDDEWRGVTSGSPMTRRRRQAYEQHMARHRKPLRATISRSLFPPGHGGAAEDREQQQQQQQQQGAVVAASLPRRVGAPPAAPASWRLVHLNLSGNALTDVDAQWLGASLPSLTALDLSRNRLRTLFGGGRGSSDDDDGDDGGGGGDAMGATGAVRANGAKPPVAVSDLSVLRRAVLGKCSAAHGATAGGVLGLGCLPRLTALDLRDNPRLEFGCGAASSSATGGAALLLALLLFADGAATRGASEAAAAAARALNGLEVRLAAERAAREAELAVAAAARAARAVGACGREQRAEQRRLQRRQSSRGSGRRQQVGLAIALAAAAAEQAAAEEAAKAKALGAGRGGDSPGKTAAAGKRLREIGADSRPAPCVCFEPLLPPSAPAPGGGSGSSSGGGSEWPTLRAASIASRLLGLKPRLRFPALRALNGTAVTVGHVRVAAAEAAAAADPEQQKVGAGTSAEWKAVWGGGPDAAAVDADAGSLADGSGLRAPPPQIGEIGRRGNEPVSEAVARAQAARRGAEARRRRKVRADKAVARFLETGKLADEASSSSSGSESESSGSESSGSDGESGGGRAAGPGRGAGQPMGEAARQQRGWLGGRFSAAAEARAEQNALEFLTEERRAALARTRALRQAQAQGGAAGGPEQEEEEEEQEEEEEKEYDDVEEDWKRLEFEQRQRSKAAREAERKHKAARALLGSNQPGGLPLVGAAEDATRARAAVEDATAAALLVERLAAAAGGHEHVQRQVLLSRRLEQQAVREGVLPPPPQPLRSPVPTAEQKEGEGEAEEEEGEGEKKKKKKKKESKALSLSELLRGARDADITVSRVAAEEARQKAARLTRDRSMSARSTEAAARLLGDNSRAPRPQDVDDDDDEEKEEEEEGSGREGGQGGGGGGARRTLSLKERAHLAAAERASRHTRQRLTAALPDAALCHWLQAKVRRDNTAALSALAAAAEAADRISRAPPGGEDGAGAWWSGIRRAAAAHERGDSDDSDDGEQAAAAGGGGEDAAEGGSAITRRIRQMTLDMEVEVATIGARELRPPKGNKTGASAMSHGGSGGSGGSSSLMMSLSAKREAALARAIGRERATAEEEAAEQRLTAHRLRLLAIADGRLTHGAPVRNLAARAQQARGAAAAASRQEEEAAAHQYTHDAREGSVVGELVHQTAVDKAAHEKAEAARYKADAEAALLRRTRGEGARGGITALEAAGAPDGGGGGGGGGGGAPGGGSPSRWAVVRDRREFHKKLAGTRHRFVPKVEEARAAVLKEEVARAAQLRRARRSGGANASDFAVLEDAVQASARSLREMARIRAGADEAMHELHEGGRHFVNHEVGWEAERHTKLYVQRTRAEYMRKKQLIA